MKESDNELQFSPNGVIRICDRFHSKDGMYFKNKAKSIAQKLTDLYDQLKSQQLYREHLPQICKIISRIYLLEKISTDVLETHAQQVMLTSGDKKIIKAVSTAMEVVQLHRVFQETAWRDSKMEPFMEEIKKILEVRIHQLKILDISQHDYQYLYCMQNMFYSEVNKKLYHALIQKVSNLNITHYDASQLPGDRIFSLYEGISDQLYIHMGKCPDKISKRIKLKLLYLRCYFKHYCPQIAAPNEDISFVHLGMNPEGFHIWELYFDEDSTCKMDRDKQFLKHPPMEVVREREDDSDGASLLRRS